MSKAITKRTPHVVIVGGGFGGLTAAQSLARAPVEITLVDRTNHHLFQPLLYQVASAGLSPAEIASPIRAVLSRQRNASVLLDEVTGIDVPESVVHLHSRDLQYDYLILAAGAQTNYFGHDAWERFAPGLKSLDDAIEIRRRVLLAYEAAEREVDPKLREKLLTFVIIGGGATGVELAGALRELSRFVLAEDFRSIHAESTRVVLLEAGPRILASFPEVLSEKAVKQLKELEVEVRTNAMVTKIDADGVCLGDERIASVTVVWGAGVRATPLAKALGVPLDRGGRVIVEKDTSIPGHPNVFVIGDMAAFRDETGNALPGVSPVAMQQARFVAKIIDSDVAGRKERGTFRYFDKGTMATIGRSRAIAIAGRLQLSGFIAWLAWLVVHIWYLIGYRNRLVVMFSWFWSYVTYKRGSRLITGHRMEAGTPPELTDGLHAPVAPPSPAGARDLPAPL